MADTVDARAAMLRALQITPLHEHGVKKVSQVAQCELVLGDLKRAGLVTYEAPYWTLTERGWDETS